MTSVEERGRNLRTQPLRATSALAGFLIRQPAVVNENSVVVEISALRYSARLILDRLGDQGYGTELNGRSDPSHFAR
jgi:hypothetical protein